MTLRTILAFAVLVAVQALVGCGMPATDVVAQDDTAMWQKAELAAREARFRMRLRSQVEAGTLGLAQLYPGGMPVEARHLPPLPRPMAVPIPVVLTSVAQTSPSERPAQFVVAYAAGRSGGCVYKPIMSDADIEACR